MAREKPSLIVEVVGPAGAGKSTLARTLRQHGEHVRPSIRLRQLRYLSFFLKEALVLLPSLVRQYRNTSWLSLQELKLLIYPNVLHRALEQQALKNATIKGNITILDQGPVFMLTWLYSIARLRRLANCYHSESTSSQIFEEWCNKMLERWSATLDFIIWLDAPDAVLLSRIQNRSDWHIAKEKSKPETIEFLSHFRTSYRHIIAGMTANDGPRLLCFDTAQESTDQIASKLLTMFDVECHKG